MASGIEEKLTGTVVAYSHHPATGKRGLCGRFTDSAVPSTQASWNDLASLTGLPLDLVAELQKRIDKAELAARDMVCVNYSIQDGKVVSADRQLADRAGKAALRIAIDLTQHPQIALSHQEAVLLVHAKHLEQVLYPQFNETDLSQQQILASGLGASPGAAVGAAYFSAGAALDAYDLGEDVILVQQETSPQDVPAMTIAEGILTTKGGLSSHAAIVARGSGTPAVCGAASLRLGDGWMEAIREDGLVRILEGQIISIDGDSGLVFAGSVRTSDETSEGDSLSDMEKILGWADDIGGDQLVVRANADTVLDATLARKFGAKGIGLCRTEHQFLGERLSLIQAVILATSTEEESLALEQLATVQQDDFLGLLRVMDGLPVTVRLLDPPLHEFLPSTTELLLKQAKAGLTEADEALLAAAQRWHEQNPMLGTRGVRLGILRPQLFRMQVRALIEAAQQHRAKGGLPLVEIMIPLIVSRSELDLVRGWIEEELDHMDSYADEPLLVKIGSMIETPRAALCASEIAGGADFFSFGTNDLTQMTFGFSRDDVETRIMGEYLERSLLPANPFETLDLDGVGRLVASAVKDARSVSPDIKLGVCGEHAGDPASIEFFWKLGLDYVSCSPYRVPIARLVAAHTIVRTSNATN